MNCLEYEVAQRVGDAGCHGLTGEQKPVVKRTEEQVGSDPDVDPGAQLATALGAAEDLVERFPTRRDEIGPQSRRELGVAPDLPYQPGHERRALGGAGLVDQVVEDLPAVAFEG